MEERITIKTIIEKKAKQEKITMLTAYDFFIAGIIDRSEIDIILVGDSLGMVVLGYDDTLKVTLDDMLYHTRAVSGGVKKCLVVGDMPFLTYHLDKKQALKNAGRFIQEAGAQAVKVEGGLEVAKKVKKIVNAGIPVMGHIGLTPQSIHQLGGYKVQGKDVEKARKLLDDAKALEEAGVFSIVLECIPSELSKVITKEVNIPTIGIGAGPYCDGQVLVTNDLLGLTEKVAKFVKLYAHLGINIEGAIKSFRDEVKDGDFPSESHSYSIEQSVIEQIKKD